MGSGSGGARAALAAALALLALGGAVAPAAAQVNVGVHAARANDVFGGSWGVGVSARVGVPLFPVEVFAAGDYFFPDCGGVEGCSFSGASLDLHFGLPLPVLKPYAAAGAVVRRVDLGGSGSPESHTGVALGVGLDLGALVIGGYAEARYELVDPDDQVVLRLGLRF